MQEMRFLTRSFALGLLTLLLLVSTVLAAVPVNAQTAASTYTYSSTPTACGASSDSPVLAITETSQDASGTLTYNWCPVPGSTTEFARDGNADDRITIVAGNPQQATRQGGSGQSGAITISNPELAQQSGIADSGDGSCESLGSWAWAACPFVEFISGAISWMDTRIQSMLHVGEDRYTNPELRNAWVNFRNIAYAILIPIMLVMVIGTALGFEMFSAYTVKKSLPRMAAAIIFITLSWHITTFLIGFFNVIGTGILGLMTSPFGIDNNMSLDTLFGASTANAGDVASTAGSAAVQWAAILGPLAGLALIVSVKGGLAVLMLYLLPVIIMILGALLVLMLRELFIIAGVLLAPVAILSWIFPGNDGLWKLWWNTFSKLLMMFPLIMLIIGAGRIGAHLIDISGGGGAQSIINPLLKLTAYVLPYMFIPFAFKFAGGAFANLAGMVNDRERGLLDRARKKRDEGVGKLNERRKAGTLYGGPIPEGSLRDRINKRSEWLSNVDKAGWALKPKERKARMDAAMGNSNLSAARQAMKEDQDLAVILGNDDYSEAGRSGYGFVRDKNGQHVLNSRGQRIRRDGSEAATRAYLMARGYAEEDVQAVRHAKANISQEVFNMAAVLSLPATGTGFAGGAGEMDAAINETVGNNRRLASTMLGEMRGTAERAGRADLKGGGYGGRVTALHDQYKAEVDARQTITNEVELEAALAGIRSTTTASVDNELIRTTDGRGIASMKATQLEARITPRIREQLQESITQYNTATDPAERSRLVVEVDKQYAKIASIYDQSQYQSPQVQEIVQVLMSSPMGPNGETIRSELEKARGRATFQEIRREIGHTAEEVANMTEQEQQRYEQQRQAERDQDNQ